MKDRKKCYQVLSGTDSSHKYLFMQWDGWKIKHLPEGVAWECLMEAEERAKERASSIWKLCQGEDL